MGKDKGKEYKDILGPFTFNKYKYGYINAIIDTDYETKYKDLIDQFNYCLEHPEDGSSILANLKETPLYNEFVTEAVNYLAYGYSLNPNFKEALVNYEYRGWFRINRFKMSISEENYATSTSSINIYDKYREKEELENKLVLLKEDGETLSIDVEKLQDPEYIARYLREKYFYSTEGEYIIRLPQANSNK